MRVCGCRAAWHPPSPAGHMRHAACVITVCRPCLCHLVDGLVERQQQVAAVGGEDICSVGCPSSKCTQSVSAVSGSPGAQTWSHANSAWCVPPGHARVMTYESCPSSPAASMRTSDVVPAGAVLAWRRASFRKISSTHRLVWHHVACSLKKCPIDMQHAFAAQAACMQPMHGEHKRTKRNEGEACQARCEVHRVPNVRELHASGQRTAPSRRKKHECI